MAREHLRAAELWPLQAAKAQLGEALGVAVAGLPVQRNEYNSVYRVAGKHEGWPRFESAEGKHLFRHVAGGEWMLASRFPPAAGQADGASVRALGGALPIGEREWRSDLGDQEPWLPAERPEWDRPAGAAHRGDQLGADLGAD